MKNLHFALKVLSECQEQVRFVVYGPAEDADYWQRCVALSKELPPNVDFAYRGELPHEELICAIRQHQFFVLPTLGENFGHAIAEALQAGLPALISDQTPWGDLAGAGIGWTLPLDSPAAWIAALQRCVDMDNATYQSMSQRAGSYADQWIAQHGGPNATRRMFEEAAASL